MKKKNAVILYLFFIFLVLLSGCGKEKRDPVMPGTYYYPGRAGTSEGSAQKEESAEAEEAGKQVSAVIGTDMYLIVSNDMETEHLILEQIATGRQYMYYYSLATQFLNKYGDNTAVSYFEPGRIVTIGEKDSEGKLKEVRISDEVWEYQDITRYSIDEERGVFQIGDTNYSVEKEVFVVSGGERIGLSSLKDGDKIRAIGMNKEILSVAVTTGNGKVELKNTGIFEGSYIQIGRKIFAEITKELAMDIPEGTYTVTVANKGYGGSTEIVVKRNQTITIDLDELKGEGPKKGAILFAIDIEGALLKIDGRETDYNEAIPLDYGIHTIAVSAAGYQTYAKKLFVNSEEATILISLKDEEEDAAPAGSASDESADASAGMSADAAGQTSQNTDSETGTSESLSQEEIESDYLSTLSELLSTILN